MFSFVLVLLECYFIDTDASLMVCSVFVVFLQVGGTILVCFIAMFFLSLSSFVQKLCYFSHTSLVVVLMETSFFITHIGLRYVFPWTSSRSLGQ